jgi:hypothetical protein
MSSFMKADKKLEADINKVESFEDLQALLGNAVERSDLGVTRDPQTGQFVPREREVAHAVPDEEQEITKTENIGGKDFTFTGTAVEVEKEIANAYRVAEAVQAAAPSPRLVAPPRARAKTQADFDLEAANEAEQTLRLRRGEISTAEFLERTNAVGRYLEEKGFDVEAAASTQYTQSWARATEVFLRETPEGREWKGGQKNLELIGNMIISHDLEDAPDKVAALRALAAEMKEKGLIFDGDYTPEQVNQMTDAASPTEILEAWKETQPDPEAANTEFIRLHNGGRFFGK